MNRDKLNKAEELYVKAYDPRMLVSEVYYNIALQKELDEAISIVMSEMKLGKDKAKDLLYDAYVLGHNLVYQYSQMSK